jgi:hypothetical protein
MTIKDNRTPEQKKTHLIGIVARDKFLSGKLPGGGVSRCAWAVPREVNEDRVFNWVKARKEMSHVTIVDLSTYRPPSNTGHFHIYVVRKDHPAANH